jgi:hypothetical protein
VGTEIENRKQQLKISCWDQKRRKNNEGEGEFSQENSQGIVLSRREN